MKYFLFLYFSTVAGMLQAQTVVVYGQQQPVGGGINSPHYEETPVLHPSGSQLYFTRLRHPGNTGGSSDIGDIWMSELGEDNNWKAPVNLGAPLNTGGWSSVIGFAGGGEEMYLSIDYRDEYGILRKGVAVSRFIDGSWAEPALQEIEYFNNKGDHQSGWVTRDGSVLLLSLEAPGGYGTEDLYVCFRQGGNKWSSPRNLGFALNTAFQEMTPFLAEDKKTLIFATNGRPGLGSRDLFITERMDDSWRSWSEPVGLGNNVNTPGTELSFSFRDSDDYAYLISTQNSEGYGDIKQVRITAEIMARELDTIPHTPLIAAAGVVDTDVIEQNMQDSTTGQGRPEEVKSDKLPEIGKTVVSGTLLDARTLEPLRASITIVGATAEGLKVETGADGAFTVSLERGLTYTFTATAQGYLEEQVSVDTYDKNEWNEPIKLQPLLVGNTVTLSHVLFEKSTANIVKGSEADLDRVVRMMTENPAIEIMISGHTDNQGPIKLNVELSEKRVQSVIDYLVLKGVDAVRLSGKGFGPTKPIASNASELTRKLNRRVEFTITKGN